jgi:hypothetical protein
MSLERAVHDYDRLEKEILEAKEAIAAVRRDMEAQARGEAVGASRRATTRASKALRDGDWVTASLSLYAAVQLLKLAERDLE